MKKDKRIFLTMNHNILLNKIRVVGSEEFDGVMTKVEAIKLAHTNGKDVIQLSVDGDTAICKIIEYSKHVYQLRQREKEKKQNSTAQKVHEVQLSPDISENDVSYRLKAAKKWLEQGDKVKCQILFKGRQIAFKDKGELVLLKFVDSLSEVGKLEALPKLEGKRMICIIKPNKGQ